MTYYEELVLRAEREEGLADAFPSHSLRASIHRARGRLLRNRIEGLTIAEAESPSGTGEPIEPKESGQ